MNKHFCILIIFSILFLPFLVFADGGMVIWPPDVYLDQSAQNAIVAWNGDEEVMILSNDIESDGAATVLRIVPLPSDPSEIKEGTFDSFEKLVEIMNQKIEDIRNQGMTMGKGLEGAPTGVEITFHKKIGAHDITVVRVNDLDCFLNWIKDFTQEKGLGMKELSLKFQEGVKNYLKRDIKYFVFDVIKAEEEKESIKPLIYKFDSDLLFYPLLITGASEVGESKAKIGLFIITKKETELPEIPYSYYANSWFRGYGYPVEFSREELEQVSKDVAALFENGAKVNKISLYERFNKIEQDLMIFPAWLWREDLGFGSRGKAVQALQKILINEGVWDSEVEATGYFGPITKTALIHFQEKYSQDILSPIGLEAGSGYFGEKTRSYLTKLSIETKEAREKIQWNRDLRVGMRGEDVRALQEILISEGMWARPDIGATGYFGPITKQAVIEFQESHASEILEPLGLDKGTGYFGASTRSFLNEKYKKSEIINILNSNL